MAYQFFGKPEPFWTGLSSLSTVIETIIIFITAIFVPLGIKIYMLSVNKIHLEERIKTQILFDNFRDKRKKIFETFPIELVLDSRQFPKHPPSNSSSYKISAIEQKQILLTQIQKNALNKLTVEQLQLAREVIGYLNGIAEYIEDGFTNKKACLGQYHTMIIRLCSLLEPVRRRIEKETGGNYGQRLLRLRHMAITYNTIIPKHRLVDIKIKLSNGEKVIVPAIRGNTWQKFIWYFKRKLSLY